MKGFWAINILHYTEQKELNNLWTLPAMHEQRGEEQVGGAIPLKKSLDKEQEFIFC